MLEELLPLEVRHLRKRREFLLDSQQFGDLGPSMFQRLLENLHLFWQVLTEGLSG